MVQGIFKFIKNKQFGCISSLIIIYFSYFLSGKPFSPNKKFFEEYNILLLIDKILIEKSPFINEDIYEPKFSLISVWLHDIIPSSSFIARVHNSFESRFIEFKLNV